ncbi:hypothetical protein QR680_010549 [Steinernema hermaphroditum]|uniref:G-protein coupled receptors family 1 profile domain-containing protein n=1 Tax=Steinernema hermaphroditum TaxID=289476 RepID=A0AA39IR84_9BILA|nr:hypothetical protein QR680_010549 [Steinernema hermaphroditum]
MADSFLNITDSTFFLISKCDSIVLLVESAIVCFGNGLVVAVTWRSKTLRSSCYVLIAVQAVCDILRQGQQLVITYGAFAEIRLSLYQCYMLNLVGTLAMDYCTILMLFIAVDRFVAAKFPFLYLRLTRRKYYLATILCSCFLYTSILKIVFYVQIGNETLFCTVGALQNFAKNDIWLICNTTVNVTVILIYVALTRVTKASLSEYQKINRSLNILILIHIIGWVLPFAVVIGLSFLIRSRLFLSAIQITMIAVWNINMIAPVFIYYFCSSVYNAEIRKMLRFIGDATHTSVQSVSTF